MTWLEWWSKGSGPALAKGMGMCFVCYPHTRSACVCVCVFFSCRCRGTYEHCQKGWVYQRTGIQNLKITYLLFVKTKVCIIGDVPLVVAGSDLQYNPPK